MNRTQRKKRKERRAAKRNSKKTELYAQYLDFNEIFSFSNLTYSAKKCLKGVGWKASVQKFNFSISRNLMNIRKRLVEGTYSQSKARRFYFNERGKKRLIRSVSFRDRIVQRCLCDYCLEPIFTSSFTFDNCASQKGKGTDFARKRFKMHMRDAYKKWGNSAYLISYDIKSYFASIPVERALELIEIRFKDIVDGSEAYASSINKIMCLIRVFVHGDKGIELGNQISQLIALYYLSSLDHFINEHLRFGLSGRYMDDGYVFVPNKESAHDVLSSIDDKICGFGLKLHPRKTTCQPITKEAIFLKTGFKIISVNGKIKTRVISSVIRRNKKHINHILSKIHQTPREDPRREILIESIKDSVASYNGIVARVSNKTSMRRSFRYWTESLS